MEPKDHDCIQERRLTRLEDKTDTLDTKIDRIMEMQTDIKTTITKVLTRLDYKKEKDKQRDEEITDEEKRLDKVENTQTTLLTQNKIIIGVLTGILVLVIGFVIEFQFKTFILGI